ncbi:MAG: glycosyltransferase [Sphingomonadales bacterium]|nr:glycosyltransferase [Sphingomonadales bacterium]
MAKIVHIISGLGSGGAENILFQLVTKNTVENQQHYVVSLSGAGFYGEKLENANIKVYYLNLKSNPRHLFHIRRIISEIKPDIVQGWMYHGNIIASMLSIFVGLPIITWGIHASNFSSKTTSLLTRAFVFLGTLLSWLSPKKIIYVSEAAKLAHERIGYRKAKSIVIANGIDTNLFCADSQAPKKLCKELGLETGTKLIGMFARFHPLKGHDTFIEAAKLLHTQNPNVHYVLCGHGIDKNNENLVGQISDHGLTNNFHTLGQRDDLPYLTAALDIASSCSIDESFSLTTAEAMSSEVSVVVTENPGAKSVVGEYGIVVPISNAKATAQAWGDILDTPKDELTKVNTMARKRIIKHFSIEIMASNYERLYQDLITSN